MAVGEPTNVTAVQLAVGIDVAKRTHVVGAVRVPSRHPVQLAATKIAATREGYEQLVRWLRAWAAAEGVKGDAEQGQGKREGQSQAVRPEAILGGLEATGTLWEPLYEALTQAGDPVLVLNPRQTVSWAASLGLRAKTDGADAHTLAHGLAAGLARARVLPGELVQSLRTLTRTRRELVTRRERAAPAHPSGTAAISIQSA